jgi:DNA-binding LytR/AlgR family response regulator
VYARFLEAVNKVKGEIKETTVEASNHNVFIKADGKFIRLDYDNILFVESMGDYVKYITPQKTYLTHSTLKAVEEKMGAHTFMKVHRSYIVNLKKIKDIQDNSLVIENRVVPISKSLKAEVLQRLNIS